MLDSGIFQTDNYYIPGEKSKGYKIDFKYQDIVKPVKIILKSNNTPEKYLNTISYNYLYKWFNKSLTIDFDGAMEYLDNYLSKADNQNREEALLYYNSQLININGLKENQSARFKIDSTGFRLHTYLTTLSSKLRKFVSYDGKTLVSLDIKNSQPYLSVCMVHPEFYSGDNSITKIAREYNLYNIRGLIKENTTIPIMMRAFKECANSQDIKLYTNLVETGKLYEYVGDKFDKLIHPRYKDRRTTKTAIFRCLFASNRSVFREREIFNEIFPTVSKLFYYLRRLKSSSLPEVKSYKLFPIQLQRAESWIILRVICKKLAKRYPEMPMFTIHDSIIVPEGHEKIIKKIMTNELEAFTGIIPTIKTEYWR